jgi:poly(hydroxyalkanoate) depolymerase family esterase
MRRVLFLVAVTLLVTPVARAEAPSASLTKHTLPAGPDGIYPSRDYYVYVPAKLAPAKKRALVVVLHGCTQTAMDMVKGTGWNQLADERGFVVAYPEQSTGTDGSAGRCWNSGQAAIFPRGQGELESVAQITRAVKDQFDVRATHVHLLGLSSGALMTNVMAATYPELYASIASVAGCSYLCSDPTGDAAFMRMGEFERVVPTIVFTGTADYLTNPAMGELTVAQWLGTNDLADNGAHDGSVPPTPTTIEHRDMESLSSADPANGDACLHTFPRNPCPGGAAGVAPYPSTVRHYVDANGREVVQSWTIHGLSHNYSGGSFEGNFTDPYGPNITAAAWQFFESSR